MIKTIARLCLNANFSTENNGIVYVYTEDDVPHIMFRRICKYKFSTPKPTIHFQLPESSKTKEFKEIIATGIRAMYRIGFHPSISICSPPDVCEEDTVDFGITTDRRSEKDHVWDDDSILEFHEYLYDILPVNVKFDSQNDNKKIVFNETVFNFDISDGNVYLTKKCDKLALEFHYKQENKDMCRRSIELPESCDFSTFKSIIEPEIRSMNWHEEKDYFGWCLEKNNFLNFRMVLDKIYDTGCLDNRGIRRFYKFVYYVFPYITENTDNKDEYVNDSDSDSDED